VKTWIGRFGMRLISAAILMALMGSPLGICSTSSQDAGPLSAQVFADRSVLMPNSSYPLVDLAADSRGQIYALAWDQVVKLSQRGELIKRVALKKGQGPGEVQNFASVMTMGMDDNLYVYDGAKFVVFTADLTFVRNIPVMMAGTEFYVDKNGNLYCRKNDYGSSQPEEFLAKYSPQGKLVGEYLRTPDLAMSVAGGMAVRTPHPYVPTNLFCLDPQNVMYFLPNTGSQVSRLDAQGTAILSFKVNTKDIPISEDEKAEVERRYVGGTSSNAPMNVELRYADHRPYFRKILIDETGRFYMVRTGSVLAKGKEATIGIYQAGHEKGELKLGGDPLIVHQGFLYYVVNKDDGVGELTGAIMRSRVPD
jgi:hypothetical protein